MQLIRTIWIILVGDHPGIIPAEFGQIPISGSREEVVWSFPYIIHCNIVTPGAKFNINQGHNLNNFGRGPLDDADYSACLLMSCFFFGAGIFFDMLQL